MRTTLLRFAMLVGVAVAVTFCTGCAKQETAAGAGIGAIAGAGIGAAVAKNAGTGALLGGGLGLIGGSLIGNALGENSQK